MNTTPLQQIVNFIKKSEKILILTHQNPDGDGVGSALALLLALRKLGKSAAAAASDFPSQTLSFLPSLENLETSVAGVNDLIIALPLENRKGGEVTHKTENGILKIFVKPIGGNPFTASDVSFEKGEADYDLIICADTPDLPQLGKIHESNPNLFFEIPVINIDHHASNTGFGVVNFVDTTAASASELVLRVIRSLENEENKELLDNDIATLILTGIITDTGSFQNSNTTPRSFEVSADLIEAGAKQQEIIKHVYKTKQLSTLKLWGRVLAKIEFDATYRMVWSSITKADLDFAEAGDGESEGVIDELMSNAPDAEIILLLKQKGDLVSGSVRTTTPAVSASEIAGIFGGGGHTRAAGFKIKDAKLETMQAEVLAKIKEYQAQRLNIVEEEKPKKNGKKN